MEKLVSSDVVRKERFRVPVYRVKKCLPEAEAERRLRVKDDTGRQKIDENEKNPKYEKKKGTKEDDKIQDVQGKVNIELKEKSNEKSKRKVRFQESTKVSETPGQPELRRSQRLKNKNKRL